MQDAAARDDATLEAIRHDRTALQGLAQALRAIEPDAFGKYQDLLERLRALGVGRRGNTERVVVFSERIATLRFLERRLTADLGLGAEALAIFHGQLPDQTQCELVQSFGTKDAKIRILLCSDAASEG